VQAALDYAAAFPAEIDLALTENREGLARVKRLLPHTVRSSVTDDELERVRQETTGR